MAGGIERMATLIMNQMVEKGFRVGLITWDSLDAEPHYPINTSVEWMKLNLGVTARKAGWVLRFRRQLALRGMVKKFKPDVVICFQAGTFIAVRTATMGLAIPMIAAERNAPDLFQFVKDGEKQQRFVNLALSMATCITVQLESYKKKYPMKLRDRIVTIHNPVHLVANPGFPNEQQYPPKHIVNIGRLSHQKNQLFLIRAFSQIASKNPDWILTLVGEGEKRTEIENLIRDLEIGEQVKLVGAVKNVDKWYKNAAFLAFPSLWEGFPNVLVEGFCHGLPAIGLHQTSGVNELLKHEHNGLLSEFDETSFASAMQIMIDDLEFRKKAGRNAEKSILVYEAGPIYEKWSQLFKSLAIKKIL